MPSAVLGCLQPIYATNTIKDNDAKLLARAEVVKDVVAGRMTKLGEYLVGNIKKISVRCNKIMLLCHPLPYP